ncbi:unnamed protein product [Boreogadus saida]
MFDPRAWDLRLAVRLNSAEHTATCWVDFALTPEDAVLMDCQEIWFSVEKPMARGPPGGVIGVLGGIVAIGLIIAVATTVVMMHRRQQKTATETDNDLIPARPDRSQQQHCLVCRRQPPERVARKAPQLWSQ